MALLDAVLDWDAGSIHAIGERHALHGHPLRSTVGLHAIHLAEYGAQAVAVHGALLAAAQGDEASIRAGRLASLREVELAVEYVDLSLGRLDIQATRLMADERGAQYTFKIEQRQRPLASGRVVVIYADS
ncbi:phosphotransferase [Dyella jejuensis]|uniref:Phosphotransferase n=1 Tax=Dyella jejuensis TaxID=1432009 RepID=A0ABW8JPC5_9GAMM